jgi:hypothetical protein
MAAALLSMYRRHKDRPMNKIDPEYSNKQKGRQLTIFLAIIAFFILLFTRIIRQAA